MIIRPQKKKNVVIICVGYSLKITDNIEISYGVHLPYAKYNVYIRLEWNSIFPTCFLLMDVLVPQLQNSSKNEQLANGNGGGNAWTLAWRHCQQNLLHAKLKIRL